MNQEQQLILAAFLLGLVELGFGDENADISGADTVDYINEHFADLKQLLED